MNTDNIDSNKADALEALVGQAGGGQTVSPDPQAAEHGEDGCQPQQATAPAVAQADGQDPFGRLEAEAQVPAEPSHYEVPENPNAQNFLQQMAQESEVVSPELSQLRAMTGGAEQGAVDLQTGQFVTSAPATMPSQRSAKLQANARKMHGQAFKQTIVPIMLVVGGLLVLLSVVTVLMLFNEGFTPENGQPNGLQTHGKYFILAALPLGAILIMGAWLYYLDIKKSASGKSK